MDYAVHSLSTIGHGHRHLEVLRLPLSLIHEKRAGCTSMVVVVTLEEDMVYSCVITTICSVTKDPIGMHDVLIPYESLYTMCLWSLVTPLYTYV